MTRNTDYAVRALIHMAAHPDRLVSTADLDRELKLPRPFMRKTLQLLQQHGFLASVKGYHGGFRLRRDPAKVRVIDLMRIFQGDVSLSDCIFRKKLCHCVATCPLRREVKAMEQDLLKKLEALTLADLIKR